MSHNRYISILISERSLKQLTFTSVFNSMQFIVDSLTTLALYIDH